VVFHNLELVVRVNYRFLELHQVRTRSSILFPGTKGLSTCEVAVIRGLFSDGVPKVTRFIVNEQVSPMISVDLVHLKLVRMNGNVWMHFSKKIMDGCVNYVTDSTADDVQWNLSFV
jgi:hypothetical protein